MNYSGIPENVYLNFKKIYLYYGKEFPTMGFIEIKSVYDWWDENYYNYGWSSHIDYKWKIARHNSNTGMNEFYDEFIKLIESEA